MVRNLVLRPIWDDLGQTHGCSEQNWSRARENLADWAPQKKNDTAVALLRRAELTDQSN